MGTKAKTAKAAKGAVKKTVKRVKAKAAKVAPKKIARAASKRDVKAAKKSSKTILVMKPRALGPTTMPGMLPAEIITSSKALQSQYQRGSQPAPAPPPASTAPAVQRARRDSQKWVQKSAWATNQGWTQIVVWGPRELNEQANKVAAARGISKAEFVRAAIERAVNDAQRGSQAVAKALKAPTTTKALKAKAEPAKLAVKKTAAKAAKAGNGKGKTEKVTKSARNRSGKATKPIIPSVDAPLPGHGAGALNGPTQPTSAAADAAPDMGMLV